MAPPLARVVGRLADAHRRRQICCARGTGGGPKKAYRGGDMARGVERARGGERGVERARNGLSVCDCGRGNSGDGNTHGNRLTDVASLLTCANTIVLVIGYLNEKLQNVKKEREIASSQLEKKTLEKGIEEAKEKNINPTSAWFYPSWADA